MSDNSSAESFGQRVPILLIGAWFALLTGFAELAVLAIRTFVFHKILFVNPQVVWMTPLSYAVAFLILGLMLLAVARLWRRAHLPGVAVLLFAFAGFFSLLFMAYPRLHKAAILLLAGGLAVQTAAFVTPHPAGLHKLVRRTFGWLLVLVMGLTLGVNGWRAVVERKALARLPAAPAGLPNVLLIILDTVRAWSLSVYGYARPTTPVLERLAQRGAVFERAIAPAPWTTPSHASMFTGHWPHELNDMWLPLRPLASTWPTLADVLRARGYLTAGFVANVEYCGYETGLNRGFVHYEDYQASLGELILSSSLGRYIANSPRLRRLLDYHEILGRKTAATVNQALLAWLSHQQPRPFFAFLNYYDAHAPYLPPQQFGTMFTRGHVTRRPPPLFWSARQGDPEVESRSPTEVRAELDAYEGAIAYVDHELGELLTALRQRGLLEHTLIIVTSDHGEQFGEHGLFSHGNDLYWPLLGVPLLIVFPPHVPERRIAEPVSLRDLPATVVDLLGLDSAVRFPGRSLARHWTPVRVPDRTIADPVLAELSRNPRAPISHPVSKGDMRSVVQDRWHYILNGDQREELYDVVRDPLEAHDLSGTAAGRSALVSARRFLDSLLAVGQPRHDR